MSEVDLLWMTHQQALALEYAASRAGVHVDGMLVAEIAQTYIAKFSPSDVIAKNQQIEIVEPDDVPEDASALGFKIGDGLAAPFPWFGGKRKIAHVVWKRFGDVRNYVEPFFGSGAVLLKRPDGFIGNETVNDLDGYVANFWRATKHAPDDVANFADNPVNENDLHARHIWLVGQKDSLKQKLEGDPDFFDAKIAGYWVWGICCWIGSGFCSGSGPWGLNDAGKLVHLGNNGQGVNRKRVHLGNNGQGVNRKRDLLEWFEALGKRLAHVRVCSGGWSRVCGPSVTFKHGLTGVFLDPPYADTANRSEGLYREDSLDVAHDVRRWAIENGDNPLLRIALCGYEGEHEMPGSWSICSWDAGGGFGSQAKLRTGNGRRERIWFSPSCL
jgi:DNA adenine methylase